MHKLSKASTPQKFIQRCLLTEKEKLNVALAWNDIMCCCETSFGKVMSKERFLKTAQRKKNLNKKKAEPSMRIEALLESTCIRIRSETNQTRRDFPEEDEDSVKKKRKLDCFADDESNIEVPSFESYTMVDERDLVSKSSFLWDDPQQVEDFLKQVSANNNTEENIDEIDKESIQFDEDFFNSSEDVPVNLSTLVTNYDINSFTIEFDNLYKELVQNLVSVETFMSNSNQTTCA